jgi:hypothetical protein
MRLGAGVKRAGASRNISCNLRFGEVVDGLDTRRDQDDRAHSGQRHRTNNVAAKREHDRCAHRLSIAFCDAARMAHVATRGGPSARSIRGVTLGLQKLLEPSVKALLIAQGNWL